MSEPLADPVAFDLVRDLRDAVPGIVTPHRWRAFHAALRALYPEAIEDAGEDATRDAEMVAAALATFATAYRHARTLPEPATVAELVRRLRPHVALEAACSRAS